MLRKKLYKDESGQILVIFAFLFITILGFVGLAIDSYYLYYTRQHIQDVADLSALSAVQETVVNHGQVESTAIEYGRKNGVSASELKVKHPYNDDYHKVEITITRIIDPFFFWVYWGLRLYQFQFVHWPKPLQ